MSRAGNRWHPRILALALALIGLTIFLYKVFALGFPLRPDAEVETWTVQARVSFDPRGSAVKVELQLPEEVPGFSILEENFVSRGFGLTTEEDETGRRAVWAIRHADGRQAVYYRAVVHGGRQARALPAPPVATAPELEEPYRTAVEAIIAEASGRSADTATLTTELLRILNDPNPGDDVRLFIGRGNSLSQRAGRAAQLLAGARIPARVAYGLTLTERSRQATFTPWLEVHNGERWLYFNPRTGEQDLPPNLFIWWRGDGDLIAVRGAGNPEVAISVQPNLERQMTIAERQAEVEGSRLVEFSLLGLPLQTQAVYGVILLIPIGALVMILMRNIIGIQTFGIFTPVLVALAFRETKLFWGIVLFTSVVALGLALRSYLEHLRLILVPRLAAVMSLVVIIMLMFSIVSHKLGIEIGLSVSLFPIVILTMAIERLSIVWEERGPLDAIQEGFGSLLVAAAAYAVMNLDIVEHLVSVFPELLLVVLAVMIMLGRYRGYRLLELFRFRELAREGD